ncbi:mycofactocin precursor MftA [Nocardia sp. AB354]|uniref:mycofactocin precursor MftA n=1 Tax=Nocardia sp. AB354 TaxID=3413283 RepID=UPI003C229D8F
MYPFTCGVAPPYGHGHATPGDRESEGKTMNDNDNAVGVEQDLLVEDVSIDGMCGVY